MFSMSLSRTIHQRLMGAIHWTMDNNRLASEIVSYFQQLVGHNAPAKSGVVFHGLEIPKMYIAFSPRGKLSGLEDAVLDL